MTALIHVLGSDIPHHNQTVLRFFNDELAADARARTFMVVGDATGMRDAYPALEITCYPGKKSLAQAAIAGIGTAAVMGQVDWKYVGSATALAGILSLLTSVAGIPEVQAETSDAKEEGDE